MNGKSKILAVALATLMTGSTLGAVEYVYAAETTTQADSAKQAESKNIIKTLDEAHKALGETRAARLAIFNGTPEIAGKLVNDAMADFKVVNDSVKDFAVANVTPTLKDDSYVPFDTSMTLSEDFVPTPEKQVTIGKANDHLAKGDKDKALETLKLADIDVNLSAAFIPSKASIGHIEDAIKLIGEGKYYEANLALKAIEDSVVVQSFNMDEVPTQGASS
ncbi:MAG: protein YfdX [marine bacterium B5-7]|nr:MAG: protein YfdX [marine bacterium B5-7]